MTTSSQISPSDREHWRWVQVSSRANQAPAAWATAPRVPPPPPETATSRKSSPPSFTVPPIHATNGPGEPGEEDPEPAGVGADPSPWWRDHPERSPTRRARVSAPTAPRARVDAISGGLRY